MHFVFKPRGNLVLSLDAGEYLLNFQVLSLLLPSEPHTRLISCFPGDHELLEALFYITSTNDKFDTQM